jgi:pimeloyl-ACP methyl ester carboxylesterase
MSDLPEGVTARDITTSRLRTHVLESGPADGTPLVLVHGNVSSARFFAELMADLPDRRCLAPDLRGFGGSEPKPVDATRGCRDWADDLHALLTEADLVAADAPVHLLGWSLGAGVVLQYALDHPDRVASIVLESPMSPYGFGGTRDEHGTPCWPDHAGSGGGAANPEMVRRIVENDRGAEDPVSPRNVLTNLYGNPPFALPAADALVEGMLELAIGDDNYPGDSVTSAHWPGVAPGERGVNNAISPRFCDLSAFGDLPAGPAVLWVRGDADAIVSDASLIDFGQLGALGAVPEWPGAEVFPPQPMVAQTRAVLARYAGGFTEHVLPGCGHSPHLERPAEFTVLVREFLGRTAGVAS